MEKLPNICIPIKLKSTQEILDFMQKNENEADLFEIWLDQVEDLDLEKIMQTKTKPVLCVCKGEKEKGSFKGNELEKADLLKKAMKLGAEYIDADYQTEDILLQALMKNKGDTKVILSYHNFEITPDLKELLVIIQKMLAYKPDIVKIATMANSYKDSLVIINLAQSLSTAKIPHITIAMSEYGKMSRAITPLLGGEMMFAPLSNQEESATGQIDVDKLKMLWSELGV